MLDIPVLIQIIALIVAVGGYTWGVVRFVMESIEKKISSEREERLRIEKDLYNKIDHTKDQNVRREDFNRHVDYVEKQFGVFRADLNNFMQGIGTKLDSVIILMTNQNKGD